MCCSVLSPEIVMPDVYICGRLRRTKVTRKATNCTIYARRCMHISADVQRITLNASGMTISGERTEQLDIFCRVTGFASDFLGFIDVALIWFFLGALQLLSDC